MKRDKRTIDEILRHYLAPVSQEEVASAGEAVLHRLQEELQDGVENFKYPEPESNWYEQLTLVAISLLRGQGTVLKLSFKADELAGRRVSVGRFLSALARLEKSGLIEQYGGGTRENPQSERYKLTPRGERACEEARIIVAERLPGYLEDLI